MVLTTLIGYRFPDCHWSFDDERVQALNRAIGISPNANQPPPTLAFSADMDHGVVNRLFALTGLAAHQLLHGEQHFRYYQPLQPGLVYHSSARLSEVISKPRFSLLHKQTQLHAPDGTLACEMLSVYVALPVPGTPSSGPQLDTQDSQPVQVAPLVTREQIQAFASASGDDNRVHLEPAIARQAGHPDVFAQGMLGMGQLGGLLPGSRLRCFGVRFLSPMALGDQPRLYQTGTTTRTLILTNEKGNIRIRGYAELN